MKMTRITNSILIAIVMFFISWQASSQNSGRRKTTLKGKVKKVVELNKSTNDTCIRVRYFDILGNMIKEDCYAFWNPDFLKPKEICNKTKLYFSTLKLSDTNKLILTESSSYKYSNSGKVLEESIKQDQESYLYKKYYNEKDSLIAIFRHEFYDNKDHFDSTKIWYIERKDTLIKYIVANKDTNSTTIYITDKQKQLIELIQTNNKKSGVGNYSSSYQYNQFGKLIFKTTTTERGNSKK